MGGKEFSAQYRKKLIEDLKDSYENYLKINATKSGGFFKQIPSGVKLAIGVAAGGIALVCGAVNM